MSFYGNEIVQITPATPGHSALLVNEDTGEIIIKPVECWAVIKIVERDVACKECGRPHKAEPLHVVSGMVLDWDAGLVDPSSYFANFLGYLGPGEEVDEEIEELAQSVARSRKEKCSSSDINSLSCCPHKTGGLSQKYDG